MPTVLAPRFRDRLAIPRVEVSGERRIRPGRETLGERRVRRAQLAEGLSQRGAVNGGAHASRQSMDTRGGLGGRARSVGRGREVAECEPAQTVPDRLTASARCNGRRAQRRLVTGRQRREDSPRDSSALVFRLRPSVSSTRSTTPRYSRSHATHGALPDSRRWPRPSCRFGARRCRESQPPGICTTGPAATPARRRRLSATD